jgi:hypothetical protein
VKTYTIDPANRARLARALALRLGLAFGAVILVVIAVAVFFLSRVSSVDPLYAALVMGAVVVVMAVIVVLRLVKQVREYRRGLETVRIEVGHQAIVRHQEGVPDLRIARGDVVALRESEAGVLVMTKDSARFLWLPAHLGSYADARERLAAWMPIMPLPPRPVARWLPVAAAIGTGLCLLAALLATQWWQVLLAGIISIGVYLYFYRQIRMARAGGDRKFRRTYDGVLMFLVIVVIMKVLMTVAPGR